jgi:hypothetical protein
MVEMVAMAAAVTVAVLAEMEGAKAVPEATAEAMAEAREAGMQAVAKVEMAHIAHVSCWKSGSNAGLRTQVPLSATGKQQQER